MFEKVRDILGLTNVPLDQIRTKREKIEWDRTFLRDAILWSERSHDPQTQCGCVLVRHNTILSSGYNGFISNINDYVLPNLRPFKYPFFIHAEHNAILNCARNGVSTAGATAYVTGEPCNWCLQYMWQAGIYRIVYTDVSNINMIKNEEHQNVRAALLLLMDNRIKLDFIPKEKIFSRQLC